MTRIRKSRRGFTLLEIVIVVAIIVIVAGAVKSDCIFVYAFNIISSVTHWYAITIFDEENKDYNQKVETTLILKIQNNSKTNTIKLFSMFPGNYNDVITPTSRSKFDNLDFIDNIVSADTNSVCVPLYLDSRKAETPFTPQVYNQFMYFRIKDAYNNKLYYTDGTVASTSGGGSSSSGG